MLVTFLYDPALGGGAAQVVYHLAHELYRRGHEVVVVTSCPQNKNNQTIAENIKIISFFPPNIYWIYEKEFHPLWQKIVFQMMDIWNPFVYPIFKKIVLSEKPDIVHFHKIRGFSPSIWKAARDTGIRNLIQTCHDYEMVSPQGILIGKMGEWVTKKSWLLSPYQWIRRLASRDIKYLTSPGKLLLDTITDLDFFNNAQRMIIPNTHGLTQEEINLNRECKFESDPGKLSILFLGRLEVEKGIWILCQAVEKAIKTGAEIELNIAGVGSQETRLKESYSNTNGFIFHGNVIGEKKKALLRQCDIVAIPSIVPEAFGITAVEAMAYGKPVLAFPVGELVEIIQEGETGFLSPIGNIDLLMGKILEIFENRIFLKDMRNACFYKSQEFRPETIVEKYLSLYEH